MKKTRHVLPVVLPALVGCGKEEAYPETSGTICTYMGTAIAGTGKRSYGGDGGPATQAILDLPVATASGRTGACPLPEEATAMRKESGTWRWQRLSVEREVLEDGDLRRCSSCHANCGQGRDGLCGAE